MCKKINQFLPIFMIVYIAGSYAISWVLYTLGLIDVMWLSVVVSQLLVLAPVLIYTAVMKINILKCLPLRRLKFSEAVLSIVFGCCLIPLVILINMISMLFVTNRLAESSGGIYEYSFLVQFVLLAVIPPLVEEFTFRGIFYHSYRKNGILGAALFSGIIFGVAHLNINQFCYAFVLGIVFALLVEATASLWSSVLAHMAVNSYSIIMFTLSKYLDSGQAAATAEVQAITDLPVAAIIIMILVLTFFAALFGMIAFLIWKQLAKSSNRSNYLRDRLSVGFRAQNGERFVTKPYVITIIACFGYMIITEFF